MNELELTGRARTHIIDIEQPRCALHYEVVASFLSMRDAARPAASTCRPSRAFGISSARSCSGTANGAANAPLFDRDGAALEHGTLSEPQLVDAILWLVGDPGGSRHHWGTDVDVIDAAAMPPGLPGAAAAGGIRRATAYLGG